MYYDRLVDDSDRAWLVKFLKTTMKTELDTNFDELFKHLDANNDGEYITQGGTQIRNLGENSLPDLQYASRACSLRRHNYNVCTALSLQEWSKKTISGV